MATNFYDRKETVYYDPARPCSYYGWHVSYSSGDLSICGFHIEEIKKQFVAAVKKELDDAGSKDDANEIAACAFGIYNHEDDGDLLLDIILGIEGNSEDHFDSGEFWAEVISPLAERFNEMDNAARIAVQRNGR